MQTIYKYPLFSRSHTDIDLPIGAKVLHTNVDHEGKVCIWVYQGLNPEIPKETRRFDYYNTGQKLPGDKYARKYIGTIKEEPYFWHVFEEIQW